MTANEHKPANVPHAKCPTCPNIKRILCASCGVCGTCMGRDKDCKGERNG